MEVITNLVTTNVGAALGSTDGVYVALELFANVGEKVGDGPFWPCADVFVKCSLSTTPSTPNHLSKSVTLSFFQLSLFTQLSPAVASYSASNTLSDGAVGANVGNEVGTH
jgi:hypothetical protein